jgi:hypothetical protein
MTVQVRQQWRGRWVLHIEVQRWRQFYGWINQAMAEGPRRVTVIVLPKTR